MFTCDFCGTELKKSRIDAKSIYGPWANFCELCFLEKGIGFGTGQGQKFNLQKDGTWKKVQG